MWNEESSDEDPIKGLVEGEDVDNAVDEVHWSDEEIQIANEEGYRIAV